MINFGEYMAMSGWKGETDDEWLRAFKIVWENNFKDRHKTIERLLCEPHEALLFVSRYEKLTGTRSLDAGTVLRMLLNVRKSKKL